MESLGMVPQNKVTRSFLTLAFQAAQLGLLLAVAQVFLIEQTYGLSKLLPVIFVGFLLHACLPSQWRGPFFVLLFPASTVLLLGINSAAALLVLALGLFLLCHLPVSFWLRVAILSAVGIFLASVRIGAIEADVANIQSSLQTQTLPILGAIFMFRSAVYLYDLRHEKGPVSVWQRLGYFFLFPNVCFPLFPVIDYQTFKRTHYDRPSHEIYQKGIDWIFRGITHLLLYRIVYHYFVPDPLSIQDLAGVAQYALSSFLLYLRVSGLFHLIVGILCLFGYNLPETHHRYYLSESFTDFWRRINIYWKDFMVKLFYYPIFMALRRWGLTSAMVSATLITFVITWALHSYQWFWLRGAFPLVPQDMIFWGVLAILVAGNSLYEEKFGRRRKSLSKKREMTPSGAFSRSLKTATVFLIICLLWSFWTSTSIAQWLTVMSVTKTTTALEWLIAISIILGAVLVGTVAQLFPVTFAVKLAPGAASIPARTAWIGGVSVLLLLIANPAVENRVSPQVASVVSTITGDQLNTRDQQQVVKGYYEELLGAEASGSMLWSVRLEPPDDWRWGGTPQSELTRSVGDIRREVMLPSISVIDKGQEFHTNQWGMRDDEYTKAKPPTTYRIALFGSSYTVGSGVRVEETFPAIVELQLNDLIEQASRYRKVEILNFAVPADSILRRAARLRKEALAFNPDAVIDISITGEHILAITNLKDAIRRKAQNIDPHLKDIVARSGTTSNMSSEEIERRLGGYQDEIVAWGYSSFAETARNHGIEAVIFMLPKLGDADSAYEGEWEILSRMWRTAGLQAVHMGDVYGPLNQRNEYKLAPWDWHPNAKGHRLIANRVVRELAAMDHIVPLAVPSQISIGSADDVR
jgi:D-alanyl-lipoteichoic acid acyltransferase DltB (MBOAT superfamily)